MVFRYKSKYKKVGVLPIQIVKSNVSSVGPLSERNMDIFLYFSLTKGPDFAFYIGSTPTFLYFDLYQGIEGNWVQ